MTKGVVLFAWQKLEYRPAVCCDSRSLTFAYLCLPSFGAELAATCHARQALPDQPHCVRPECVGNAKFSPSLLPSPLARRNPRGGLTGACGLLCYWEIPSSDNAIEGWTNAQLHRWCFAGLTSPAVCK